MLRSRVSITCAVSILLVQAALLAAEDILLADFEGTTYGDWKVTGEAFGPGPARGTLPKQMEVSGFEGRGLVNSFYHGDGTTGTLVSPPFRIERRYINFLVGGGKYPGTTCINLLVDGENVRTATGPNDRPGGSERLRWGHWDVSEFSGKEAVIQVVDQRSGGWGHINVDHIIQSDERASREKAMKIRAEKRYLNLPVKNGAPKRVMRLLRGETILREFGIELAEGEPDFWVVLELTPFKGETLTLWSEDLSKDSNVLDAVTQAGAIIGAEDLYKEKYRPQFHFSSRRGWNNDPNGMVYYAGEYHLFYQHNPYGWNWGNMTWGHAVSKDLVHWTELGDAIHPDHLGTIFSGSAVVDEYNTTGFQTGDEKVLVCIYTSAGGRNPWSQGQPFTQSIAYSNDRGRTWTIYEGNPVQEHVNGSNRDPKVIWHEPTNQWVIVLYLDDHTMGFYTSRDLKSWEFQSTLNCFHECPELFELPVDGDESNRKWVLYGASGDYFTGSFDGKTFTPESDAIAFNYGDCFYASQTFNNVPAKDGRRIQIAWGRIGHPSMPFNQMMDFPVELTLRTTEDGVRIFAEPVDEIALLHGPQHSWKDETLEPGTNLLSGIAGGLFHILAEFQVADGREFGFAIHGVPVRYDAKKEKLSCEKKSARLKAEDGKIRLEMLVDRISIEIFANNGRVYMPMGVIPEDDALPLEVFSKGGAVKINALEVFELRPAWE